MRSINERYLLTFTLHYRELWIEKDYIYVGYGIKNLQNIAETVLSTKYWTQTAIMKLISTQFQQE